MALLSGVLVFFLALLLSSRPWLLIEMSALLVAAYLTARPRLALVPVGPATGGGEPARRDTPAPRAQAPAAGRLLAATGKAGGSGRAEPEAELPANPDFVGRAEALRALERTLLAPSPAGDGAVAVVQGPDGTGKTRLAEEFENRSGGRFAGVHWLNASLPVLVPSGIADLGVEMEWPDPGLPAARAGWPERAGEQVHATLLAWQASGPRLVVLDAVEDVESLRPWLARLRNAPGLSAARAGGARVLVTTSLPSWPAELGAEVVNLQAMEPGEGHRILRQYVPESAAPRGYLELAVERVGGTPLALKLAGMYLATRPELGIPAFLRELEKAQARIQAPGAGETEKEPNAVDPRLAAVFALVWQQVQSVPARRVLHAASYCAADEPIPMEALAEAADLTVAKCEEVVDELAALGLVETDDDWDGPAIHPVVAGLTRAAEAETPQEPGATAKTRVAAELPGGIGKPLADMAAALLAAATPAEVGDEQGEEESLNDGLESDFAPLRPHVAAIAQAAEANGLETAGELWAVLGDRLCDAGELDGARTAFERALAFDERTLVAGHPNIAVDVSGLARTLRAAGDLPAARVAYERALALDEAAYGPAHAEVATDLENLGEILRDLGELPAARVAFERALVIKQLVLGRMDAGVADTARLLGKVLGDEGCQEGARSAFEWALGIHDRVHGASHPIVARDLVDLGAALVELERLDEARIAYERAAGIYQNRMGPNDPSLAAALVGWGRVRRDQGDLHSARELIERALEIDEAALGPDDETVASDLSDLGTVLQQTDDSRGALEAYRRALAIYEAVHGPDHADVAVAAFNMAKALEDLGDLPAARAAYEHSLAVDERVYGSQHLEVAADSFSLGGVLMALGDADGARAAYQRALAIREAALPTGHADIAEARDALEAMAAG
jgi:tetratricopeptide (TPR) repeat protein